MNNNLLHQLFENCTEKYPGKIAISEENRDVSYASLNDQANYLARILHKTGVGKDTVVSYLGSSGIDMVASLLGIFKAGGIYMPVEITLPAIRICGMFEETGCRTIIISRTNKKTFLGWQSEWKLKMDYLIIVDEKHLESVEVMKNENSILKSVDIPIHKRKGNAGFNVSEDDPNYIFYTSGSTGSGKPILGWHKGLAHFINWETNEFHLGHTIRVSQLTKITFDASLRDIFIPLINGGTLYIPREETRSNTIRMLEWLESNKISLVHIVPSVFRLMCKELRSNGQMNSDFLLALKYILMAGEPLYSKDISAWRETAGNHVELINLYGTSETTMAKTFHRIREIPSDPGQLIHAGHPVTGAFIAIINNGNELCRIGEIGEIYIKTPYRTKGYYRNVQLTNSFFVQNPINKEENDIVHKTGDMGRYLSDRSIEVLGRSDDQVKINGMRLQLRDIEHCMLGCEGVDEAVVIVSKGHHQENELVAYYTGTPVSKESLRQYMAVYLGELMVPAYLVQLKEFPLNANGKINKKELPRPDKLIIRDENYESALPGVETQLEIMWKELLGVNQIGRKIPFFEIGGNSLKAIQLISRIYKQYHLLVKINEIFSFSTIEALADHIQKMMQPVCKEIPVLPQQNDYELSRAQSRLWAINQVENNKSSYNVPAAFEIKGNLNIPVFSHTIKGLVERHEILRTRFIIKNGEPRQQITPFDNGDILEYVDMRNKTDKSNLIQEWIRKVSHVVFDLERGPLFWATLLHVNEDEFVYLVTIHHIICDAWSLEILNKEMLVLYDALINGKENLLPPLRIHYKEFSAWQNNEINGSGFGENRNYWLNHLSGNLPRLNLPLDYPRPEMKRYNGKINSFHISAEQKEFLNTIAKQNDVSLFMVVLALLNTLLYKYTRQNDIIIGSPVAGREHPDLEYQVGLYINTVLLRNRISPGNSFIELLRHVKENTVLALKHQGYPFDLLVDHLEFEQDRSRNILFDAGFTYLNENIFGQAANSAFDKLAVKELDHKLHDVKADLWFKTIETVDSLIFTITYSTDLFKPSFIERLSEDIRFLISAIIQNSYLPVSEIIIASDQNLVKWEKSNRITVKKNNSGKLKALQPWK